MPRPILFVVGQTATVAFLAPVWRRWLEHDAPANWRVIASPEASYRISMEGLDNLPLMFVNENDTDTIRTALGGWKPHSLIMSASFAKIEQAALNYARSIRLPTARIIDTWYSYRNRLTNPNGELQIPDKLLVIDEKAANDAAQEDLPPNILQVVGHPAWERIEKLSQGDRRDIMFVSQPIEKFYGNALGYTEKTVWKLFLETIRRHPDLVRRVYYSAHPDDEMRPPEEDGVEVVKSGHATLPLVGAVVGMYSSLVTEALLAGRHVVSFQPGAVNSDMRVTNSLGLAPVTFSQDELASAMRAPTPDIEELRSLLKHSCDRVEAFCLNFAND